MKLLPAILLLALGACSQKPAETPSDKAKAHGYVAPAAVIATTSTMRFNPAAVEKAKALILEDDKVKDIRFDPELAVEWHVAMVDDGSRRHGYAESVCLMLAEAGASDPNVDVRIVDAAKIEQFKDAYREYSLGWVHCADGAHMD